MDQDGWIRRVNTYQLVKWPVISTTPRELCLRIVGAALTLST